MVGWTTFLIDSVFLGKPFSKRNLKSRLLFHCLVARKVWKMSERVISRIMKRREIITPWLERERKCFSQVRWIELLIMTEKVISLAHEKKLFSTLEN